MTAGHYELKRDEPKHPVKGYVEIPKVVDPQEEFPKRLLID